jgi:hypothetical protein
MRSEREKEDDFVQRRKTETEVQTIEKKGRRTRKAKQRLLRQRVRQRYYGTCSVSCPLKPSSGPGLVARWWQMRTKLRSFDFAARMGKKMVHCAVKRKERNGLETRMNVHLFCLVSEKMQLSPKTEPSRQKSKQTSENTTERGKPLFRSAFSGHLQRNNKTTPKFQKQTKKEVKENQ